MRAALRACSALDIQSVLLEGGAALHAAAWDEGVVDYVQLYVAPVSLGAGGRAAVRRPRRRRPRRSIERRVELLGPDVLIEGYVHRPH